MNHRTDFYRFATPDHVWAARCPHCDQIVATIVDVPDLATDILRYKLRWERDGLIVERLARLVALARLYRCTCADLRKAARRE